MKRRSRSRRRSGRPGRAATAAALALVLAGVGVGALPAQSFLTAAEPRGASAAVADDGAGLLGLDAAPAVHVNETDPLVNVTDDLGRRTDVTVELRAGSTFATLVVGGRRVGNRTTLSLAAGTTRTVSVELPDDSSLTDDVVAFDVRASAPGLSVRAPNRSVPVNT